MITSCVRTGWIECNFDYYGRDEFVEHTLHLVILLAKHNKKLDVNGQDYLRFARRHFAFETHPRLQTILELAKHVELQEQDVRRELFDFYNDEYGDHDLNLIFGLRPRLIRF